MGQSESGLAVSEGLLATCQNANSGDADVVETHPLSLQHWTLPFDRAMEITSSPSRRPDAPGTTTLDGISMCDPTGKVSLVRRENHEVLEEEHEIFSKSKTSMLAARSSIESDEEITTTFMTPSPPDMTSTESISFVDQDIDTILASFVSDKSEVDNQGSRREEVWQESPCEFSHLSHEKVDMMPAAPSSDAVEAPKAQHEEHYPEPSGKSLTAELLATLSPRPPKGSSARSPSTSSASSSSSSITTTSGELSMCDDGLDATSEDQLLDLIHDKLDELMDLDEMDGKSRLDSVVKSFKVELSTYHPNIDDELKSDLSLDRFNLPHAKLVFLARIAQCVAVPMNNDFHLDDDADSSRWCPLSSNCGSDSSGYGSGI